MNTVVNIHKEKCDIYIGRKKEGMHFGNPFSHIKNLRGTIYVQDREMAVLAFSLWLSQLGFNDVEPERREWINNNIETLRGKKLGCFCKPLSCHGDFYIQILDATESF